jgi:hypothetical protein
VLEWKENLLLFDDFSVGAPLGVPAFGFRLRVWMPSFFMASGRLTCHRIQQINFVVIILMYD